MSKNKKTPTSGYRLAAQFHYTAPFGLKPVFDFVNSPVSVFERKKF